MTNAQNADSFYDSDDELPSLDTLLTRLPGRIQQQLSQPKPISHPKLKNTIIIELDDGDSSEEDNIAHKGHSLLDLGDKAHEQAVPSLVKGEVRKRCQPSSGHLGNDVGGEGEKPPRSQSRLINTRKTRPQESDLRSRKTVKDGNNMPSTKESQMSTKQPRCPSKIDDGASGNTAPNSSDSVLGLLQSRAITADRIRHRNQDDQFTQRPRNVSPSRNQITKSDHQPQLPERGYGKDIARPLSRLHLDLQDGLSADALSLPTMPPRKSKQMKPLSPHGDTEAKEASREPSMDTGHHQEPEEEWDEPDTGREIKSTRPNPPKLVSKKQTKKSFDAQKSQLAIDFLQQLDTQITHGRIGQLTESTGGVKIVWSNTLKTTAGRANWKREAVVSKHVGDSAKVDVKQYRHHSSIELSEKVIDDEVRLLNVIAHEFCHLANFMINGITDNPHGKEFKVWATKCSQLFASQGIKVTTKHTYEIDFKYVWTCTACDCEYKRHSKSIDPQKHRCGACKALLEQTKPTPRRTPTTQLSGYQLFVKEQMKVVKSENPNSPQKEIMRIIADRWAQVKT
ncbi:SprT-like family domain-containing protein [Trichoderma chlorosporum]